MITPADFELVLRAIRNASDDQLRAIVECLSTAGGMPVELPVPVTHAVLDRRAKRRAKGTGGDGHAIAPKS